MSSSPRGGPFFGRLLSLLLAATVVAGPPVGASAADAPLADVAGAVDSPIVSRFAGSILVGYHDISFGEESLPLAPEQNDGKYVRAQAVEGHLVARSYLAPPGKTALEVQRNYRDALTRAGFVMRFSCDGAACGRAARIQEPFIKYAEGMKQVQQYGGYSSIGFLVINTGHEPHLFWGTLKVSGRDMDVLVFSDTQEAVETSPLNGRAGTFVLTIEPKPVDVGQVTVDVNAMKKGLAADGKIALYGIYFDTGKADVKPESKAQLDEMARLLNADRSLKVYIVGHTDNQGVLDANLALSQRRADAIVAALLRDYQIDPKRLIAKGIANFSPVASNDAESGRAMNRRVELVKQ